MHYKWVENRNKSAKFNELRTSRDIVLLPLFAVVQNIGRLGVFKNSLI